MNGIFKGPSHHSSSHLNVLVPRTGGFKCDRIKSNRHSFSSNPDYAQDARPHRRSTLHLSGHSRVISMDISLWSRKNLSPSVNYFISIHTIPARLFVIYGCRAEIIRLLAGLV